MPINRAIGRLGTLFLLIFALLGGRALWLQAVAGPRLAADERNPRGLELQRYRGAILARDGTVLAQTTARTSSSTRSIQAARSVTLELDPVMTNASASRGPGTRPMRTSLVSQLPGQASPVCARIHRG